MNIGVGKGFFVFYFLGGVGGGGVAWKLAKGSYVVPFWGSILGPGHDEPKKAPRWSLQLGPAACCQVTHVRLMEVPEKYERLELRGADRA